MRLDEERALYGFADDDGRPDPANAQTAAEFVALLGAFVERSELSLAEIEDVARSKGYVLPETIIATALSHDALPPEELVVALVRSIGINDREVKYWADALWRLESRAAYDPDREPSQEHERKAPYDIGQIYVIKDEPEPAGPYAVPAPYEVGQVPDADERVAHDGPHGEAAPVSPAASQGYSGQPPAHAVHERRDQSSQTGMHRRADRDDNEDDDAGRRDDAQPMRRHETRDDRVVRESPRIRDLATPSIGRVNRKAKWPLPVAVGLSVVLAASAVTWAAIGGSGGEAPGSDLAGAPQHAGSAGPTAGDGSLPSGAPEVVPGTSAAPPADPNPQPTTQGTRPDAQPTTQGAQPNPQPTTKGPQPSTAPARNYNTALSGTGSTTCTSVGGQWRVRISVNVTVSDAPPGVSPQGQAGPTGSTQGFSLSGGGSSFSGSTTVSMGPDSSPDVGTVQWVVTMSVPGGRVVRDESYEGYSCA